MKKNTYLNKKVIHSNFIMLTNYCNYRILKSNMGIMKQFRLMIKKGLTFFLINLKVYHLFFYQKVVFLDKKSI